MAREPSLNVEIAGFIRAWDEAATTVIVDVVLEHRAADLLLATHSGAPDDQVVQYFLNHIWRCFDFGGRVDRIAAHGAGARSVRVQAEVGIHTTVAEDMLARQLNRLDKDLTADGAYEHVGDFGRVVQGLNVVCDLIRAMVGGNTIKP